MAIVSRYYHVVQLTTIGTWPSGHIPVNTPIHVCNNALLRNHIQQEGKARVHYIPYSTCRGVLTITNLIIILPVRNTHWFILINCVYTNLLQEYSILIFLIPLS